MALFPWFQRKKPEPPSQVITPRSTMLGYCTASLQEQGQRSNQEDSWIFANHQDVRSLHQNGLLAVVADGMGGMRDGKLASGTAVNCFYDAFLEDAPLEEPAAWLEEQVCRANRQIHQALQGQGGSTLVACLIHREKLWFASVGDSYLFLLRGGELSRLNRLQTILQQEFQAEIASGGTDPSMGRRHREAHALTGFLGMEELSDIDLLATPLPLQDGDTLLLCSDGVGGMLDENDLLYCLQQGKAPEVCNALRQRVLSKANPYQDNFTALVIQCLL